MSRYQEVLRTVGRGCRYCIHTGGTDSCIHGGIGAVYSGYIPVYYTTCVRHGRAIWGTGGQLCATMVRSLEARPLEDMETLCCMDPSGTLVLCGTSECLSPPTPQSIPPGMLHFGLCCLLPLTNASHVVLPEVWCAHRGIMRVTGNTR